MIVKDSKQIVRTTDVVHIYDDAKDINWFIAFEKTNGVFNNNGAREMMNYDLFIKQGADYMQKVYELANKHISENQTTLNDKDMIEIQNLNVQQALELLLFNVYKEEFEIIDGLNQHRHGWNFYDWLHRRKLISTEEHVRITSELKAQEDNS